METETADLFGEFGITEEQIQGSRRTQVFISDLQEKKVCSFKGNNLKGKQSRLLIGFSNGQVYLMKSIREFDIEEFRFNIDILVDCCWSHGGDLILINAVYSNCNYIYLVGLDGDLLREVQMEEFVNSLSFDLQDQRIFVSSEKQISEFFLRRDFQFCFLKESGQLIFQE